MELTSVNTALKILALPEGPNHKELQKQARVYLRGLSKKSYEELRTEALRSNGDDEESDEYVEKLKLFKQLGFTARESQAYARMRVDSPGVRRVIARRALLMKLLKRNTLPRGMTFHEVARMEDSMLKDLSPEDILKQLGIKEPKQEVVSL